MKDTNINHGSMIGSAQGRGNQVIGNRITIGPDETRQLTGDLLAQLEELTAALGTTPEVDERTRILAEDKVGLLREATSSTPQNGPLIGARWGDLHRVLAGVAKAGTSIAAVVESIGTIVRTLAGS
jgi:hypothetical protein